jgi:hypothetical protein
MRIPEHTAKSRSRRDVLERHGPSGSSALWRRYRTGSTKEPGRLAEPRLDDSQASEALEVTDSLGYDPPSGTPTPWPDESVTQQTGSGS